MVQAMMAMCAAIAGQGLLGCTHSCPGLPSALGAWSPSRSGSVERGGFTSADEILDRHRQEWD